MAFIEKVCPPEEDKVERQRTRATRVPVVVGRAVLPPGVDAFDQLTAVRLVAIEILEDVEGVNVQTLGIGADNRGGLAAL